MANFNKVMLIGRLTRDPEARAFSNGGKVVNFGFAVTNRKKNQSTGEWEDDPMFIDVKIFNRGENGTLADRAEQSLHKGNQIFLEGRLVFEQWDDKQTGQKRSKHVLVVDNFQYLEPRQDGARGGDGEGYQRGGGGEGGFQRRSPAPRSSAPARAADFEEPGDSHSGVANNPPDEDNIPF